MINQVTLIGRVVEKPTLRNYSEGFCACTLTLAVTRAFKNMEGNYDTDFLKISLWNAAASNTCEYVDKGDIVAVKGRIISKEVEISFDSSEESSNLKRKITMLEIIGERVIYIHSYRKKAEEIVGENTYQ